MKDIEQNNVARKSWHRSLNILTAKVDVPVAGCDATSLSCFPQVDVKSENRLPETAFTQIKREQTKPATDVQDRLIRATKQFVSRGINGVAPQLAPHITTEPAL